LIFFDRTRFFMGQAVGRCRLVCQKRDITTYAIYG
jgi:hypothetical protein